MGIIGVGLGVRGGHVWSRFECLGFKGMGMVGVGLGVIGVGMCGVGLGVDRGT